MPEPDENVRMLTGGRNCHVLMQLNSHDVAAVSFAIRIVSCGSQQLLARSA